MRWRRLEATETIQKGDRMWELCDPIQNGDPNGDPLGPPGRQTGGAYSVSAYEIGMTVQGAIDEFFRVDGAAFWRKVKIEDPTDPYYGL